MLTLWEWPCADAGVFIAGDLCERLRDIAADVGGRGEGSMGVGVGMDVFLGVETECGLAALGVAIALKVVTLLLPVEPLLSLPSPPAGQAVPTPTKSNCYYDIWSARCYEPHTLI